MGVFVLGVRSPRRRRGLGGFKPFRVGETLETLRRRVILATLAHYRTRRRTAEVLGISLVSFPVKDTTRS